MPVFISIFMNQHNGKTITHLSYGRFTVIVKIPPIKFFGKGHKHIFQKQMRVLQSLFAFSSKGQTFFLFLAIPDSSVNILANSMVFESASLLNL